MQEIEACRTYASEFERLEVQQMFSGLDHLVAAVGMIFACSVSMFVKKFSCEISIRLQLWNYRHLGCAFCWLPGVPFVMGKQESQVPATEEVDEDETPSTRSRTPVGAHWHHITLEPPATIVIR